VNAGDSLIHSREFGEEPGNNNYPPLFTDQATFLIAGSSSLPDSCETVSCCIRMLYSAFLNRIRTPREAATYRVDLWTQRN
jgi:hypothetical protein